MRWIDAVESHEDHSIVRASIDSSHLLAGFPAMMDENLNKSGNHNAGHNSGPIEAGIDALAGIEIMAQSVGARVTDRFPERAKNLGFLLGVRRYHCKFDTLAYGDYEIEVRDVSLFFKEGIGIFDTRLLHNGEELASGQIKAFLASNPEQQQEILDGRLQ